MNEMYREKADKITSYKTWSDNKKIDALLELNAQQYCNLGTDSTKTEWQEAELTSRYMYRLIKNYNYTLGKSLLRDSIQG
jgi:hypothetical protein